MSVRVSAPAKVNLSLRVLGTRDDGFHEIRTVFQAVDLADEVVVDRGGRGVSLRVVGADLGPDRENLAYRAAAAFLEATGESRGAHIELVKRIPAGAGLGGGSSDAAAVLRCLAASSGASPPPDLSRLGASIGSDVPFFLGQSTLARGEGRGEILSPMPALPEAHMVLALPPVHVSTAGAYRALGRPRMDASEGRPRDHEAPGLRDWDDVIRGSHNDFEAVVAPLHEEILRSLDGLRDAGARLVLLSGSGAASFGLFTGAGEASGAAAMLTRDLGWSFVPSRTLVRMPEPTLS